MDAAQTNLKKIALLLTMALLLAAPVYGVNPPSLQLSTTTVTLGVASCNDFQIVNLSSSGAGFSFTVQVHYPHGDDLNGDAHGTWVSAQVQNVGSTVNGAPFTASVPDSTSTTGTDLQIGLDNFSFLANQQDDARVILTPTNGAPQVTIVVTFQYSQSCTGNPGGATNGSTLTISPSPASFNVGQGAQSSFTLLLTNLTASPLPLDSCTIQNSPQWLSGSSCSTIPASGSVNFMLTANGAGMTVGQQLNTQVTITPHTGGAVTVPVQVTVVAGTGGGGGGGSTLTLNGATSNTLNQPFSYVAQISGVTQGLPASTCIGIQDSDSSATGYTFNVTTNTGGGWLLANNQVSGRVTTLLAASVNACVTVGISNAVFALTTGTYQGSIALTSVSNTASTATINVSLFVTAGSPAGINVSPGLAYTFPGVAVGSSSVQQQQFSVAASNGATINGNATLTTQPSPFYFLSSPSGNANSQTFIVAVNPAGLTTGVYSNVITVPTSPSNTNIVVSLTVGTTGGGGGGGGASSLVVPTSLAFQQQSGSTYFTSGQEAQSIIVTGASGTLYTTSISYNSGANWLQFDQSSGSGVIGNGPATIQVDLATGAGNLSPGTYTATVNVTTPSGTVPVTVSLLVTGVGTPVLLAQPASTTFVFNGSVPAAQMVTVVGSDNTTSTTSPTIQATTSVNWLSASTSGNTLTLNVVQSSVATMALGSYSTTVAISNGGYTNQLSYPVVLVVASGASGTGVLTLSTSSMNFPAVIGTATNPQTLTVQASTATSFSASTSTQSCTGSNWLSIAPSGVLSTPASIQVSVNQTGISAGTTCNGTISLTVGGNAQTVSVSMVVSAAGTGGNVTVTPTTMTFPYTQGGTVPAAQTATIVNATSGTASIPFTVSTAVSGGVANWLQTNVTQAQTPYNNPGLSVSVVPGTLSPGNYQGTVTISPTGGAQDTIQVTLTISGTAIVTASPTTMTLSYTVGGNSPTGTIQVSAGGAAANFTAVAAANSGGTWLTVSPTSGTTPNTGTFNLTVSVNPTNLSSGQYTGSVTVTGTSPASGTTIVNITLNVTAPLPTITGVNNGASGATGGVSPGEVIQIFANTSNPIGPANRVQLDSTTCPAPCTSVPTTMGGVTVTFLPDGDLAPLLMVSAGQINAVVPYGVAGLANLSVEVKYLGQTSNAFQLTGATVAPGIFSANLTGTGQAVAWMYDAQGNYKGPNAPSTPAQKGWIIAFYMTGEGQTSPAGVTGKVIQNSSTLPLLVPSVQLGGQPVTLAGYAEAGGVVSGVLQVNFFVPQNAPSGSAVSLAVNIGGKSSQAGITVAIQ